MTTFTNKMNCGSFVKNCHECGKYLSSMEWHDTYYVVRFTNGTASVCIEAYFSGKFVVMMKDRFSELNVTAKEVSCTCNCHGTTFEVTTEFGDKIDIVFT